MAICKISSLPKSQCLMIKTKDKRTFFAEEKNYPQLIEFARLFKAEISVIKVNKNEENNIEVLELSQLAPALCDASYRPAFKPNYEVLEVKIGKKKRNRDEILKNAQKIKKIIKKSLLGGKDVTLKDLMVSFKDMQVTKACLCTHLAKVRSELEKEGYRVTKTGSGSYRIN